MASKRLNQRKHATMAEAVNQLNHLTTAKLVRDLITTVMGGCQDACFDTT